MPGVPVGEQPVGLLRAPAALGVGVDRGHVAEHRVHDLPRVLDGVLAGKKPGAGWEPQTEELTFAQEPGSDQRPYDRLIGAALDGERWLFARQDTVENAWKIVDPVLGDVTPVHPYAKGSWGPNEASRLLPDDITWYNPAG